MQTIHLYSSLRNLNLPLTTKNSKGSSKTKLKNFKKLPENTNPNSESSTKKSINFKRNLMKQDSKSDSSKPKLMRPEPHLNSKLFPSARESSRKRKSLSRKSTIMNCKLRKRTSENWPRKFKTSNTQKTNNLKQETIRLIGKMF